MCGNTYRDYLLLEVTGMYRLHLSMLCLLNIRSSIIYVVHNAVH